MGIVVLNNLNLSQAELRLYVDLTKIPQEEDKSQNGNFCVQLNKIETNKNTNWCAPPCTTMSILMWGVMGASILILAFPPFNICFQLKVFLL